MRAPVSREEVQDALASRGLSPLHRFGQNFLVRPDALDRIVDAAEVKPGDLVVEVGPGLGALTDRLLDRGAQVIACEIDRGLAAHLGELFGTRPEFDLIEGDVMATKSALAPALLQRLEAAGAFDDAGAGWKVVANLPYGISSPFLAALATLPRAPERAVVTVQREVGDTLQASPGEEAYTPLSFVATTWFRVRRVMKLGPESFHPQPKVHSVVMGLDRITPAPAPAHRVLPFARRLFQTRRKALGGTVQRALAASGIEREAAVVAAAMEAAGIPPGARIDGTEPARIVSLFLALADDA